MQPLLHINKNKSKRFEQAADKKPKLSLIFILLSEYPSPANTELVSTNHNTMH